MKIESLMMKDVTEQQMQAFIDLGNIVCPALLPTEYLRQRFSSYERIVTAHDNQGLASFQLIQEFVHNDQYYVYLGPLFSRQKMDSRTSSTGFVHEGLMWNAATAKFCF